MNININAPGDGSLHVPSKHAFRVRARARCENTRISLTVLFDWK